MLDALRKHSRQQRLTAVDEIDQLLAERLATQVDVEGAVSARESSAWIFAVRAACLCEDRLARAPDLLRDLLGRLPLTQ